MKRPPTITIRRQHLGLIGIVYFDGQAFAVRYAPNTPVTEALVNKSWNEQRTLFRRYDDDRDLFL